MMAQKWLFFIFASLAILSALNVVLARSPVRAALSLILCFFSTAVIWLLLRAEFLSISLIVIYVGAVMVLFLFVIMMLDVDLKTQHRFVSNWATSLLVTLVLTLALRGIFSRHEFHILPRLVEQKDNIKALGLALYSHYLYPFEIAGVILLVAIVAAISLTQRPRRRNKAIDPALALQADKTQRLKILKMDAEAYD